MVDLHSHVLPGADDGASSLADSKMMLDAAWTSGTTAIAATPHWNAEFACDAGAVAAAVDQLNLACGGKPAVYCGCEFHLSFDGLERLLEAPAHYTIHQTQYLLTELPDGHLGRHVESVLQRLLDAGLVPMVAHPERTTGLQSDLGQVEAWGEMGCLMQVTALSIEGGFGSAARKAAWRMLERGLVQVVASDAHDPEFRHPRLDAAYRSVLKRCGEDVAVLLFNDNPQSILDGRPVAAGKGYGLQDRKSTWWRR